MTEAAEKEWEQFKEERDAGMQEIAALRRKAAEVLDSQPKQENGNADHAPLSAVDEAPPNGAGDKPAGSEAKESAMEVDDSTKENGSRDSQEAAEKEREKERPEGAAADEDDAVEY